MKPLKKYIPVLAVLAVILGIAAFFSLSDLGINTFAALQGRSLTLGRITGGSYDQFTPPPMPPVRAPEGTIVLTFPPRFIPEGMTTNPLTGLLMSEEAALRRPFAVVINNIEAALPQYGVSQADIIYEVIAEGVTTRLIAIYQDFDSRKIGSVRSARDYFVDIALDYDAFFIHFGGSPQSYTAIRNLRIDNIDGIRHDGGVRRDNFDSVVFWRDADRWQVARLREHSAFTSAYSLLAQARRAGFRFYRDENWQSPFNFFDQRQSPPGAVPAGRISVTYVSNQPVVFVYNPLTGQYYRYQHNSPQIHGETGLQMAVDNVIVQLTNVRVIPGDGAGRRQVDVVGSGRGYLFTNGTQTPITWSKASSASPTQWFFEDGEKMTLNRGTTWINITNREPVVE